MTHGAYQLTGMMTVLPGGSASVTITSVVPAAPAFAGFTSTRTVATGPLPSECRTVTPGFEHSTY